MREPFQVHIIHRDQSVTCINITTVTHMEDKQVWQDRKLLTTNHQSGQQKIP